MNDTDSGEFTSSCSPLMAFLLKEAAAADLLTHDDIPPIRPLHSSKARWPPTRRPPELKVVPADVAWFPVLVREYPKPMPFVPVIDNDLRLVGSGTSSAVRRPALLRRFRAVTSQGLISVAGITIDEPIADIPGRFETAAIKARAGTNSRPPIPLENDYSPHSARLPPAPEDFIRKSLNISGSATSPTTPPTAPPSSDQYLRDPRV